jgi:hypothetical protein
VRTARPRGDRGPPSASPAPAGGAPPCPPARSQGAAARPAAQGLRCRSLRKGTERQLLVPEKGGRQHSKETFLQSEAGAAKCSPVQPKGEQSSCAGKELGWLCVARERTARTPSGASSVSEVATKPRLARETMAAVGLERRPIPPCSFCGPRLGRHAAGCFCQLRLKHIEGRRVWSARRWQILYS